MEQMARMGEWIVSEDPGVVLTCIGLGSCIGVAVVDRRAQIAGLAHVMLPAAPVGKDPSAPGKFADLAVPALLAELQRRGAARHRLEAVLVGGAQMFAFGQMGSPPTQDIGARNEAAVREQLSRARVAIRAAAVGGSHGRSVRVTVTGDVTCRVAGGEMETLLGREAVVA